MARLPYHIKFMVDAKVTGALNSLVDAEDGDYDRLARRLERGVELSDQERIFLAKFLRGEIKKPRHRPAKKATQQLQESMAFMVYVLRHLRGGKQDAAILETERYYGRKRSSVMAAVAKKRKDPGKEEAFDGMAQLAAEAVVNGIPDLPVVEIPLAIKGITFDLNPEKSTTSVTGSSETDPGKDDKSPAVSSRSKSNAESRKFLIAVRQTS